MPSSVELRWTILRRLVQGSIGVALAAVPAVAQTQLWLKQFGSPSSEMNDFHKSTASSDGAGGVFVCGETAGSLGGPNLGSLDAWVARVDQSGALLWLRQFGTTSWEMAAATAPDGQGGVYVCGETDGNVGGPSAGQEDVWLARFDPAGTLVWARQIGTSKSDIPYAASSDDLGGVYVAGFTQGALHGTNNGGSDAFVARFAPNGTLHWVQQFGSTITDVANAAAPDGVGGVVVAGYVEDSNDRDCWIVRLDARGTIQWRREFGSPSVPG